MAPGPSQSYNQDNKLSAVKNILTQMDNPSVRVCALSHDVPFMGCNSRKYPDSQDRYYDFINFLKLTTFPFAKDPVTRQPISLATVMNEYQIDKRYDEKIMKLLRDNNLTLVDYCNYWSNKLEDKYFLNPLVYRFLLNFEEYYPKLVKKNSASLNLSLCNKLNWHQRIFCNDYSLGHRQLGLFIYLMLTIIFFAVFQKILSEPLRLAYIEQLRASMTTSSSKAFYAIYRAGLFAPTGMPECFSDVKVSRIITDSPFCNRHLYNGEPVGIASFDAALLLFQIFFTAALWLAVPFLIRYLNPAYLTDPNVQLQRLSQLFFLILFLTVIDSETHFLGLADVAAWLFSGLFKPTILESVCKFCYKLTDRLHYSQREEDIIVRYPGYSPAKCIFTGVNTESTFFSDYQLYLMVIYYLMLVVTLSPFFCLWADSVWKTAIKPALISLGLMTEPKKESFDVERAIDNDPNAAYANPEDIVDAGHEFLRQLMIC